MAHLGVGKSEAGEQPRGAAVCLVAVDFLQALVAACDPGRILRGLCLREPGFGLPQLGIAIDDIVQRNPVAEFGFLGYAGHRPVPRQPQLALVSRQFAANQGKQRRLAAAVGAGNAELLPRPDFETDVLEQQPGRTS